MSGRAVPFAVGGAALALLAFAKTSRARESLAVEWIPSPNFQRANRSPRDVRLIVIHTMQAPKTSTAAENGARNWFALPSAGVASHFIVDSDHVVQCVKTSDIAYHVKGANEIAIGIEHAGYAQQTADDWADLYNRRMLDRSARLVAELCDAWQIPPVWLSAAQVKAGARGITGHAECSDAFLPPGTGHHDPGDEFPRTRYAALVKEYMR